MLSPVFILAVAMLLAPPLEVLPPAASPPLEEAKDDRAGIALALDDPNGRAMQAFHAALRKTAKGRGKTRILQFGASHTAADLMTGYLRDRLQERFGNGGHGFFMPARPWRTYRHEGITFKNPKKKKNRWKSEYVRWKKDNRKDGYYGLAGMVVSATHKKQWQKFGLRDGTTASHLEIWYQKQRRGGDFYVRTDNGRRKRVRTRGRKGLGVYTQNFRERSHRFQLHPKGNGEVRIFGGVLESSRPGVVVDTLGINGARAASILGWNEALWGQLVRRRKPDLIILAYGTNEAGDRAQPIEAYEASLRAVLKRVRRAAPSASCALFGPTDRPKLLDRRNKKGKRNVDKTFRSRPRVGLIVETQRKVSREFGCGFFDAVAATGGQFSIVSWADLEPRLAYADYVHFTGRGYRILSDLFADALMADYDKPKDDR
jgi:lysophospholipase L1-like esterase